jgi:hypothetical protein
MSWVLRTVGIFSNYCIKTSVTDGRQGVVLQLWGGRDIRELMIFRRIKANILADVIHDLKLGRILWQDVSNESVLKEYVYSH